MVKLDGNWHETPHDPRFDETAHLYYRNAHAAIVMYRIDNYQSHKGENNTLILEKYLPPNDFEDIKSECDIRKNLDTNEYPNIFL